jgi:hypothetical protein
VEPLWFWDFLDVLNADMGNDLAARFRDPIHPVSGHQTFFQELRACGRERFSAYDWRTSFIVLRPPFPTDFSQGSQIGFRCDPIRDDWLFLQLSPMPLRHLGHTPILGSGHRMRG